jgi:hypothetical protein
VVRVRDSLGLVAFAAVVARAAPCVARPLRCPVRLIQMPVREITPGARSAIAAKSGQKLPLVIAGIDATTGVSPNSP